MSERRPQTACERVRDSLRGLHLPEPERRLEAQQRAAECACGRCTEYLLGL